MFDPGALLNHYSLRWFVVSARLNSLGGETNLTHPLAAIHAQCPSQLMVIKMKILNPLFLNDALIYILSYKVEGVLPECLYQYEKRTSSFCLNSPQSFAPDSLLKTHNAWIWKHSPPL